MQQSLLRAGRLRSILRLVFFGLSVPGIYFCGAGLAFTIRLRAANAAYISLRLPPTPVPLPSTRLMVFAPHCDDETLGCAGLIQQTLAAGGQAHVVILTNGDGFRTAVEIASHHLRVTPSDYIRFAVTRQQESNHAMSLLGMKPGETLFLGYPDRGLLTLWDRQWTADSLYTSETTHCDHSPYPNTYHPSAAYCGQSLLDDIKATMRSFHPTLITVTHPSEDHIDHAAAAAFVTLALHEFQSDPREQAWASQCRLVYYLVHRGDWPQPQGLVPTAPLSPPEALTHVDTHWMSLPLSSAQTAIKLRSIDCYTSQLAMMGRFLQSFARSTELYGEIATASLPEITMPISSSDHLWDSVPPAILDPIRDNLLRDLDGGGDIRALYACGDPDHLYIRLVCRRPIMSHIDYLLTIRAFGPNGLTDTSAASFHLTSGHDANSLNGLKIRTHECSLDAAIPWARIAPNSRRSAIQTLGLYAQTSLQGVEIDRTGIRFLQTVSSPYR